MLLVPLVANEQRKFDQLGARVFIFTAQTRVRSLTTNTHTSVFVSTFHRTLPHERRFGDEESCRAALRQCVASMSWSLPSICALASLERIPQRLGLQADRVSSARSCTGSVV